jgi:hypothetical protein
VLLASGAFAQSEPRDTGTGEGKGTAVGPETRGGGTEAGQTGKAAQAEALIVVTVHEKEKQIVAQSPAGGQKTIVLGQDTKIQRHGRSGAGAMGAAIELGDIEPGDRIVVTAAPAQGNRLTAQQIEVIGRDVGAGGPGMGSKTGAGKGGEEGPRGSAGEY